MRLKAFNLKFHLISFGSILLIGTVVFRLTDLDLLISDFFYFKTGGWTGIDDPFWGFVYKYFTGPNLLVLYLSVVTVIYATFVTKHKKIKWSAWCIVIAIVIGPGLLVNGTIKPLMGRPRPNDMERYNGSSQFVRVLDPSDIDKSFPSGHAASGFVLTILFYVFYRDRKKLAWVCWFGGIGLGIVLSAGRMLQGGHFASDNLWAFGITQLVNCIVYFKLEPVIRRSDQTPTPTFSQARRGEKYGTMSLIAVVTILFGVGYLINFPFTFHKTYFDPIAASITQVTVEADLRDERIKLFERTDRAIGIDYLAFANGFPWSDAVPSTSVSVEGDRLVYRIRIEKKGTFRDYRGRVKLFLPKPIAVDLSRMQGEIVEDNRKQ
jgi:membrane-associated PAP2 superfamily phosphatase